MSRIFDALQRSEAERLPAELSSLSGAEDLLQIAERRYVSKWGAASSSSWPVESEHADINMTVGALEDVPIASAVGAAALGEHKAAGSKLDIFSLFQSQQITLTPESRLVCLTDKDGPAAEAFRLLAVRLRHLRRTRPLQRILVTSTLPEEGKSLIAANLAHTLARRTEQRVLLLEGDIRRPSLSKLFGLGNNAGLCEWLQGTHGLTMSIHHLEGAGLWILPAVSAPGNPQDLVESAKLSSLLDQLVSHFDWIVIDSPPMLPLADTSIWTQLAEGILLVTRQGVTQKRQLQRGLETLEVKKLIGAVVNCSTSTDHNNYYYRTTTVHPETAGSIDPI